MCLIKINFKIKLKKYFFFLCYYYLSKLYVFCNKVLYIPIFILYSYFLFLFWLRYSQIIHKEHFKLCSDWDTFKNVPMTQQKSLSGIWALAICTKCTCNLTSKEYFSILNYLLFKHHFHLKHSESFMHNINKMKKCIK